MDSSAYKEKLIETPKNKRRLSDIRSNSPNYFQLIFSFTNYIDIILIALGMIGSLISGISMPIFARIFGSSIDLFTNMNLKNPKKLADSIQKMAINYILAGSAIFVFSCVMITFWTINGKRLINKIQIEYFKLILHQEQAWFDSKNPFEISTKVQSQIKKIENGLGDKVGNFAMSVSMFIGAFIIAYLTSWRLALVLTAMLPLLGMGGFLVTYLMRSSTKTSQEAYERAGGIAEEVLYSIKTVASFSNFSYEVDRYNHYLKKSMRAGIKGGFKTGFGICFIFFSIYSTYALAVWYGSKLLLDKQYNPIFNTQFQAGDVITVLFAIIFGCLGIGQAIPNLFSISDACAASKDLFELRKKKPLINTSVINKKVENFKGNIIFENVRFSYPTNQDVEILKNISFEIQQGMKVAIVGESGSGKSTIVNLLLRLYENNVGKICFDGIDIKTLHLKQFRNLIGYVPQEPILFNDTIKENIIFGRENVTDRMILDACEKAYAHEFIKDIEDKYNYVVGVKGNKLSGGQKQRIAIARAILMKPKLLLLDEATSALDNKAEQEVQKALDTVSKDLTTIIIAHKLSTIINSDLILVLQDGEIIEKGTHIQLIQNKGVYSRLLKSQVEKTIRNKSEIPDELNEDEKSSNKNINESKLLNSYNKNSSHPSYFKTRKNNSTKLSEMNEKEVNKYYKSIIWRLLKLLRNYKCIVIFGAIFASFSGTVWPAYGFLLAESINTLLDNKSGETLAFWFFGLAGWASISAFFQHYCFTKMGEVLAWKLRKQTFEKYLKMHIGFFDKKENTPGALLSKLATETSKVNGIAMSIVGVSFQALTNLILGITLGTYFNWILALINIVLLPIVVIESVVRLKIQNGYNQSNDKINMEASNILSESVLNTKSIFSYNMQDKVLEMYAKILNKNGSTLCKSSFIKGILYGFSQFMIFVIYAILFFVSGKILSSSSKNFTRLDIFVSMLVLLFAAFGVGQSIQYVQDYDASKKALISIYKILDEETLIDPYSNQSSDKLEIQGKIEFKDVSFSYPTRKNELVLKNISFVIEAGQKAAFVGFSGSGKSTIIQLLERFYDANIGEILIDNHSIKTSDLIQYRKNVGLVMQEPILFSTSIKENIKYGRLDCEEDDIYQAARDAFIDKYVSIDNQDEEKIVSGGEKQRIAIARVLIKKPKILLLDEATSALDKNSEEIVQKSLVKLMKGRTSIIVAHRLSTVIGCDIIFMLEKGIIIERGTHEELMKNKGKYYNLFISNK